MRLCLINVLVLVLFIDCKERPRDELLKDFYPLKGFNVDNNTRAIFLFSDKTCPSCNQRLVTLVKDKIGNDHFIFIVSASPNSFDISAFLQKRENILIDMDRILYNKESMKSRVYFLNNNEVDTILNIDPSLIDEQMMYIKDHIGDGI